MKESKQTVSFATPIFIKSCILVKAMVDRGQPGKTGQKVGLHPCMASCTQSYTQLGAI